MWHRFKHTSQTYPSQFNSLDRNFLLQSGFTLLEILIVLVIVGVLASMTMPRYQSLVVQNQVDAVASELVQGLAMARNNAQSYAHSVKICPVTNQQLNQLMPQCSLPTAAEVWQAWVLIEMGDGVPTRVLMRSNQIPQSVQVCVSKVDNSSQCDPAALDQARTFNSMGQPTKGFTIRVAARQVDNVVAKIVVLAGSGRVRYA